MRRDKSFADDLVERPGRVRSRVALLLRATERKPDAALICTNPDNGGGGRFPRDRPEVGWGGTRPGNRSAGADLRPRDQLAG